MVSARWRWQAELANYYHKANRAKNEFRGLETAAGERLLETPRHFWPWRMAKPISRGWLRSSFIPALPSNGC